MSRSDYQASRSRWITTRLVAFAAFFFSVGCSSLPSPCPLQYSCVRCGVQRGYCSRAVAAPNESKDHTKSH